MSLFRRRSDTGSILSSAPAPMDRVTSVLGPATIVKGRLSGSGGVRIEGSFEGDISLDGLLVIGENGKVTSDQITATIVVIAGIVKGNITAEKVEIRATGRVWGDITTSAFATQEGAFLRGQVRMEEHIELEFIDEEEFDEGDSKGLSETGVESALAAQEEAETTAPPAGVVIEVEKMGSSSIESAQSDSGDGAGGQDGEPEEPPAAGGAVRQAKKEKKS